MYDEGYPNPATARLCRPLPFVSSTLSGVQGVPSPQLLDRSVVWFCLLRMNQAVKRLPGSRDLVAEQRIRNLTSFLDLIERDSYQKPTSYVWLTCGSSELLTSDVLLWNTRAFVHRRELR